MTRNTRIEVQNIEHLLLDEKNPRLGGRSEGASQQELLKYIIEQHGINDLLTSMSTNGFFDAEPIVGVDNNDGTYTIVEGNRRLATAILLTGDLRGEMFTDIARRYIARSDADIINSLADLPLTVFKERNRELISYIGARHIRGNKSWDSYAKATWLFELLSETNLNLDIENAARLVGDANSNTIKRVIEAYILVNQLETSNRYHQDESTIGGKGSNTALPFSWVYTAIGYDNIRRWTGIDGITSDQKLTADTKVLNSEKSLDAATKLMTFLFGSKPKSIAPSIKESREITKLNSVVLNRLAIKELEEGAKAAAVAELLRPTDERLFDLLFQGSKAFEAANNILSGITKLETENKAEIHELAGRSNALTTAVLKNLENK